MDWGSTPNFSTLHGIQNMSDWRFQPPTSYGWSTFEFGTLDMATLGEGSYHSQAILVQCQQLSIINYPPLPMAQRYMTCPNMAGIFGGYNQSTFHPDDFYQWIGLRKNPRNSHISWENPWFLWIFPKPIEIWVFFSAIHMPWKKCWVGWLNPHFHPGPCSKRWRKPSCKTWSPTRSRGLGTWRLEMEWLL